MSETRRLIVIADDFGIGPATSRGILDCAEHGALSGTVLLANSPHADDAVREWRRRGMPLRMGWHPCLTLDRPVLSAGRVPSLVGSDGRFHRLRTFLFLQMRGRIAPDEVQRELAAQYQRFTNLVGRPPAFVNGHQHIHILPQVGSLLGGDGTTDTPAPCASCSRAFGPAVVGPPRLKRAVLNTLGRWAAMRQEQAGFPGTDWLMGITDHGQECDPKFFERWLTHTPGSFVELMVHPGHHDETLLGRDRTASDGGLERRVQELRLLQQPAFRDACRAAGFSLAPPTTVGRRLVRGSADVA